MSQPILLGRAQFEAVRLASTEASRPHLCGLHVAADGSTTATDGHVAVMVSPATPENAADFPTPADWTPPEVGPEGFILPTAAALAVLKSIPRGKVTSRFPLLAHALVESVNDRVTLATTDLDSRKLTEARPIDPPYPNIRQVMPKDEPTFKIRLDLGLLKLMAATLESMGDSPWEQGASTPRATFEFHGPDQAVVIRRTLESGETVTALLMPIAPEPNE